MLQGVAVCCSVIQRVAVRCSVLQCVAICRLSLRGSKGGGRGQNFASALKDEKMVLVLCATARSRIPVAACCSVLQCVTVCCSVSQCVVDNYRRWYW